jgi:antitoxin MazE
MKTRIINIGNSRGIRIPKPYLEQTGLSEEVEILVDGNEIILRPTGRPRAGWDAAFREMAADDEDRLLDGHVSDVSTWDAEEWEW